MKEEHNKTTQEHNIDKFYLIYGLKSDFTYLEIFDDYNDLMKYFMNFVDKQFEDDYRIIYGKELIDFE